MKLRAVLCSIDRLWLNMQFFYVGFTQQANTRLYRFQGVLPTRRPTAIAKHVELLLSADLSLWPEFNLHVQDGPALCAQILAAGIGSAETEPGPYASYAITRDDLTAFSTAHSKRVSKPGRRKPRPNMRPSASSQLRWPRIS